MTRSQSTSIAALAAGLRVCSPRVITSSASTSSGTSTASTGIRRNLVLQDVLTLHGSQFMDAALIVASPPCQAYSYRAMPWSRAKALPPPDNTLFDACFRIQREACEAAGRHIPLIVENVRGAQKWVGRSRWNFGSFHLWGDVPALMPMAQTKAKRAGHDWNRFKQSGEVSPHWRMDGADSVKDYPEFNEAKFTVAPPGRVTAKTRDPVARCASGSQARKAASAMIAKIPFALSSYIARTFKPQRTAA